MHKHMCMGDGGGVGLLGGQGLWAPALQAGSITFNQSLRGFMSLNGREAGSLGNRELGP